MNDDCDVQWHDQCVLYMNQLIGRLRLQTPQILAVQQLLVSRPDEVGHRERPVLVPHRAALQDDCVEEQAWFGRLEGPVGGTLTLLVFMLIE